VPFPKGKASDLKDPSFPPSWGLFFVVSCLPWPLLRRFMAVTSVVAMDQFLEDIRRMVRQSKSPDFVIAVLSALIAWMIVLRLRMVFS
jgi:hypothetical protein